MSKQNGGQGENGRETSARRELLALTETQVEVGRVKPVKEAFKRIRGRVMTRRRTAG